MKEYDIAIAYAQGTPTFYVADCVQAKKKYAWINATYKPTGRYRDFVLNKYWEFDKIACVSGSAHEVFKEVFPEVEDKGTVIYDINDGQFMMQMADMGATEDIDMKDGKIKLLTIGRLAEEKGYDIALEACEILKQREIPFVWYALGRGSLEEKIREIIAEKKLGGFFVLLGTRSNPYPYIKYADIYIQTSKTEGYGLAIAEARMLNTPVVTTRFDAVYAQMVDGENGLVVDMTPEAVADGIERLIKDKQLYEHIVNYQKQEKKGNYEEINKFYSLIEE